MQVKAKYTNVPVQYDVRRSQQKQNAKKRNQPETTNTEKHQTNPTKQKTGHANKTNQNHEGGGATNTNQDNGQRGGQTRPNKARARGEEGKRRPANKEGADAREGSRRPKNEDSRRRGRKQGQEEEAAQAEKKGACSSSGVLRGDLDHLKVNTSVQEGRAPEQHSQHGVEGRAPHRAEVFVAMRISEDRCQAVTTHHATGMTTGPSQIQPDAQREGPAEHRLDQKAPED